MALVKLELNGILDRDDALVIGDEPREHIEQSRLTGAGAPRDQYVEPSLDARLEQPDHLRRQRAEFD